MPTTPVQWLNTFQANTGTASTPTTKQSEITGLANGNFLVSWVEEGTSGVATSSGEDIVGQLYDSFGFKIGSAFQLNTSETIGEQDDFEVVATDDGGFIMTYRSEVSTGTIKTIVERYNAAGSSIDFKTTLLGSYNDAFNPQIAFNLNLETTVGTVTLEDSLFGSGLNEDISGRLFNSSLDNATFVDLGENSTFNDENKNSIAFNTNGEIVSVYIDAATDVQLDVYSATGVLQHTVDVDSGLDDNADPRVVTLSNGFIAVAWAEDFGGGDYDIKYRVYDSNLNAVTSEANVAALSDVEDNAAMIALPGGGFVIAWDNSTSPNNGLYAQVFDNNGAKVGSVATLHSGAISNPELGVTVDGRLLYTYTNGGNIFAGIMDPRDGVINTIDYNPSGQSTNFVEGDLIMGRIEGTVINGDSGADTIIGGDGDDTIDGAGGADSLRGGDGDDVISAEGNDSVDAGGDDDLIIITDKITNGNEVAVDVDGGGGVDTLDLSDFSQGVDLDLNRGTYIADDGTADVSRIETVIGGSGDDTLVGESGAQRLEGGIGNDTLDGGFGSDTLLGGSGDDTFIVRDGHFIDAIDGGADDDTLDLSDLDGSGDAVVIDLQAGTWDGRGPEQTITSIETVIGSQEDDVITGNNSEAEDIDGQGGADLLDGGSGDDTLRGGAGDDTLEGNAGRDSLSGGDNDDLFTFSFGDGIDDIDGGDGVDTFNAVNALENIVIDMTSNLHVHNANGIIATFVNMENVATGQGADGVGGNGENNIISTNAGNDTLDGDGGNDTLDGGTDADIIFGGGGDDSLIGGGGDDTLQGDLAAPGNINVGTDTIRGGDGNDTILYSRNGSSDDDVDVNDGGADIDTFVMANIESERFVNLTDGTWRTRDISSAGFVRGTLIDIENIRIEGDGDVDIRGDGEDNHLSSTSTIAENVLEGMAGDDTLSGGGGNDTLTGGTGRDDLDGGEGDDLFIFAAGDEIDSIDGGDGIDTFNASAASENMRLDIADGTQEYNSNGDETNFLNIESLIAGSGNDLLRGGNDANVLIGNDGADTIEAGEGADQLSGGKGKDHLSGEKGADHLSGGNGKDTILGGNGEDTVLGGDYGDRIKGGKGFDQLSGEKGDDKIYGEKGEDILLGGKGADTLIGGNGDDTLDGGKGDDFLNGGDGADYFVFVSGDGNDTIKDFNATANAEDIDLSAVSEIVDFADLSANHMVQDGANVVIDDGVNLTITLLDVALADLGNADFQF
ncbi:calcium-binding protein [Planktotalea sp.]|uniref:calcium-binding protein n=1 Tax=Planktotalea sp. TaxID=2029877 RepID=UPI003D6A84DE